MLDHRSIALQGVGYSPANFALQGFLPVGEAVQVALNALEFFISSLNPDLQYSSQLTSDVIPLHLGLYEPFVGMVQIVRRGLRVYVSMKKRPELVLRLVDNNE